jgi:hypothetical protein
MITGIPTSLTDNERTALTQLADTIEQIDIPQAFHTGYTLSQGSQPCSACVVNGLYLRLFGRLPPFEADTDTNVIMARIHDAGYFVPLRTLRFATGEHTKHYQPLGRALADLNDMEYLTFSQISTTLRAYQDAIHL